MKIFNKFKNWFKTAKKIESIDATSFALGTEFNGKPNVRMVLLKHVTNEGFILDALPAAGIPLGPLKKHYF